MSSAARSSNPETLSGPVAVCVDRPVLSLDRPFTYDLSEDLGAGVGSLVQVPFHGKAIRGWVLGSTEDVPARMLRVRKLVSPVRFFDEPMLGVLRWVSERYVAPLASVIERASPPRVASEEVAGGGSRSALRDAGPRLRAGGARTPDVGGGAEPPAPLRTDPDPLQRYANGPDLLAALEGGAGAFVLRPAPSDEVTAAVGCVAAVLHGGRSAIVLVPEAEPLPATADAIREVFGDEVAMFLGGDKRERYRMWLDIQAGRYRVVVGTRPAVFAPIPRVGLVYVHRESHALHREERSPYFHVRDVALARSRSSNAVAVMAALCPSLEAQVVEHVAVWSSGRVWPPVEVVKPGPEGRAIRLVSALRSARRAFLYAPLPGYGVARVCRACLEPAACAACGATLRLQESEVRCAVCGTLGRCARCGASDFGIARGGAERVEEWARGVAPVPVDRIGPKDRPRPPGDAEVLVGGVEAVKDFGTVGLDLVGILDADIASRRPGLAARERALATWFEAAAWARPSGRVIVQTRQPNDAAVQALVTGRPDRFVRDELPRRAASGFPVGFPVFRVIGTGELEDELTRLCPRTMLVTDLGGQTVCLLALDPEQLPGFGRAARALAERGVVARVEAEPHL
jgi:primosomal protein N' (replication factor Y)